MNYLLHVYYYNQNEIIDEKRGFVNPAPIFEASQYDYRLPRSELVRGEFVDDFITLMV